MLCIIPEGCSKGHARNTLVKTRSQKMHGAWLTVFGLLRHGKQIFLVLVPPRSALRNVLWHRRSENLREGISLVGLRPLVFPPVASEELQLDQAVQLPAFKQAERERC